MTEATRLHYVVRATIGCILGIITAAVIVPHASAHAAATRSAVTRSAAGVNSCSSSNQNVDGWDKNNNGGYGNRGYVFINTDAVIDSLHDAIFRNLFVTGDANNYVEGGWTAKNGPYNNPVVYAEWKNQGADSGPKFYIGYTLTTNVSRLFTIENVGDIAIFRFYVDNQSTPYKYSPGMNFQNGYVQTNSEYYNTCDSLFGHFYNLNYYNFSSWTSSYDNLECLTTTSSGWLFNKVSNTQHFVSQTSGITC